MKVLYVTIFSLVITVTEALAAGGGSSVGSLGLLTIFFMGFGALILVFQLFPAVVLFIGMIQGIMAPAAKRDEAAAATGDKNS